ncbi:MAG: ATP:cob(I)alamin adenosyltransferase [Chlorobiaceae bacterium]|nr:ATP:cob(I)alamin adenosyltransferase [Chlorobiaceae bacterium]MBA4308853.1 ATP:cob(I)alamin adenosyltransferase [Chlorobiaceae bacterium]
MKIYTKTGDKGETSLFGGKRVTKDSDRIEAYGTVDELNSFLGLAIAEGLSKKTESVLIKLQSDLFSLGSDLATPLDYDSKKISIPRISQEEISFYENMIDDFSTQLDEIQFFILPGGTKAASILHIARTVCRRAEREVVHLKHSEKINQNIVIFLNRISDFLFVLSRYENKISGNSDISWNKST